MQLWEGDTHFWRSVRDLPRAVTLSSASAALVAALLGVTGPTLLVYQAAVNSGFTSEQTAAWFFAIFAVSGVFSVWLAMAYRQPICGAYSIAGAALLLQALPHFTLAQAVGAYVLQALLITALALTAKNPMLPAAATLGWEWRKSQLPPALKKISVLHHLQSLCPAPVPRTWRAVNRVKTAHHSPAMAMPMRMAVSCEMPRRACPAISPRERASCSPPPT